MFYITASITVVWCVAWFLLVVDRTTRSLVISIRGTLSLHDMLTDLNAGRTRISEVKTDWEGHEGMVRAAQNLIRSDLRCC